MTASISGFVFGFVAAVLLWRGLSDMFARPAFQRSNYRGVSLATSAGIVTVVAVLFAAALIGVIEAMGIRRIFPGLEALYLSCLAAGGFGMLGLLDDLAVDEGLSGFRGHVRAATQGRLTAGSLKMLAGPAVALVVATRTADSSLWSLLVQGGIIALSANLANLFDRAPGRVTKTATVALVVLGVATALAYRDGGPRLLPALAGAATMLGASWGLMRAELREQLMLGDAGANPLGAVLGLAVVLTQSPLVQIVVLVVLVALNLLSEVVSFSRIIRGFAPLRILDDLGRDHSNP